MTRFFIAIAVLAALCGPSVARSQVAATDVSSPEAIIKAAYESISGPAGQPRDFARLRMLFSPEARFVMVETAGKDAKATSMTEKDFEAGFTAYLQETSFYEREASHKIVRFGHIANVLSVYESRHELKDVQPFQRGLNSFQLFFDGKRWWIQTLFWQDETDQEKLPATLRIE